MNNSTKERPQLNHSHSSSVQYNAQTRYENKYSTNSPQSFNFSSIWEGTTGGLVWKKLLKIVLYLHIDRKPSTQWEHTKIGHQEFCDKKLRKCLENSSQFLNTTKYISARPISL